MQLSRCVATQLEGIGAPQPEPGMMDAITADAQITESYAPQDIVAHR